MPQAQAITVPAPTRGLNARDTLSEMELGFAIQLDNVFPDNQEVVLRRGTRRHATVSASPVESLFEYAPKSGANKLIAAAGGNIYDCTTLLGTPTDLSGSFSAFNNRWQAVNYKNTLILVNGVDQPLSYDLSNGLQVVTPALSGPSANTSLVGVSLYKERLYFTQIASTSIWYGASNSIGGALTEFNCEQFLRLGGQVIFAGAWSRDSGDGLGEYFVVVSNKGEILIYDGSYPGDNSWSLVGRFYIGQPLDRRSFLNIGNDLIILSTDGVVPLSSVIGQDASRTYATFSDAIDSAFSAYTRQNRNNLGWQAIAYPVGRMAVVNVPLATNGQAEQLVLNTQTGAWCRYTGWNACHFAVFNEKLYYGGANGKIYECDYGLSDDGAAIEANIRTGYLYAPPRSNFKRFTAIRPLFLASEEMTIGYGVDANLRAQADISSLTLVGTPGSPWDTSPWDLSAWRASNKETAEWVHVGAEGHSFSLRFSGQYKDVSWSLGAIDVTYEVGGVYG